MDDNVKLVKQNKQVIENIKANVQPKLIFIDDVKIPIEEGDCIIRKLPNGLEEIYKILDRGFYNTSGEIPAHYQVKVEKVSKIIENGKRDLINLNENEIDKVFIVHGHNETIKETVVKLLRSLGLQVTILHEQPNLGKTIIEKLIYHSNVNYAVVLLTSDDVGRSVNETELKKRSRQNVILELGYFMGKLDRSKVCTLYEEGIELPSDYLGVVYIPFGNDNTWKKELIKELKASGLKIKDKFNLEDNQISLSETAIPTELTVREKIEEGAFNIAGLGSDRQSIRKVVNWLPADWQVGILVVSDGNPTRWGKDPQMYYYLEVKSQVGILDVTWGAQNFYYYKSWTEIKEAIIKNYPPEVTDWADGSIIAGTVWRNDSLWNEEKEWESDTFWENDFWNYIYSK